MKKSKLKLSGKSGIGRIANLGKYAHPPKSPGKLQAARNAIVSKRTVKSVVKDMSK
jgi:hypothetical protein